MTFKLFNTMTRKKAKFSPLDPNNVRMYVCGPTVYDYAHIGNARPVIVFDLLARLLRHLYGSDNVTYVRNITDIDDKIILAHQETGESISSITTRTTNAFHHDMAALGNLDPDIEPRATDHVGEMQDLIKKLISKGHAYVTGGHVLFDVSSMAEYGKLSPLKQADLIAGARVGVATYKKHPADFVLWKPSEDTQPGWESPWGHKNGRGRPGWHIECSAMSEKYLSNTFDIHGGGIDLIFPHHENEIAQSCSINGVETFAKVWMHNGYLMVDGEKMSKSQGNFITVKDSLNENHGETIRLCMLMTHYRQPINWTNNGLIQAKEILDRWYGALRKFENTNHNLVVPNSLIEALKDDLNTPSGISAIHKLVSSLNKTPSKTVMQDLLAAGRFLGLLNSTPEEWFKWKPLGSQDSISDSQIETLIAERTKSRENGDFAEADNIRNELANLGIVLEDNQNGTSWKRS